MEQISTIQHLKNSQQEADLIQALTIVLDLIGCSPNLIPTDLKRITLINFCLERFTPQELIEAFKQAIDGKIEAELNLYGSPFNALYVSNVVKAYRKSENEKKRREQKLLSNPEEASTLKERSMAIWELIRNKNPEIIQKIVDKANEIKAKKGL